MPKQSKNSCRKSQLAESRASLKHGVEYLALTHAGLGDGGIKRLAGALLGNKTLRWLHLDDNQIGDNGARYLGRVLRKNTPLRVLDLDFNQIGRLGALSLASGLAGNNFLQELDLHCNQIGSAGAIKLAEALEVNSSLLSFSLYGNAIGDVGATSLAQTLRKNTTLRDLHLGKNAICDTGTLQIAEALKTNRKLWALHLTENEIGDVGATSLAKVLLSNPSLGELWLLKNKISEVGAQELLKCMQKPGSLRRLGITFYEDNNNKKPELLDKFKQKHTLQHAARRLSAGVACLHVDNPKLGDEGVNELVELVQSNKKVKELHLMNHCLSDKGMTQIARALQQCEHIEKIYLGGRDIGGGRKSRPRLFVKKPSDLVGEKSRKELIKQLAGEVQQPQQHNVALTAWKHDVPLSPPEKSDLPGPPRGGLQGIDGASESGAPKLAFSEVPSTLGLDTMSNITDNFSSAPTIEDQEQDAALGMALRDGAAATAPTTLDQEQSRAQLCTGVLLVENADDIQTSLRNDAAGNVASKRKRGFFKKMFFRGARNAKAEEDLRKQDQSKLDSTQKLTFDQVPETLPDISDTESSCSGSSVPTKASNPNLSFDGVPSELPVSDDEEEEDQDEEDDNHEDSFDKGEAADGSHSLDKGEAGGGSQGLRKLGLQELDQDTSRNAPTPGHLLDGEPPDTLIVPQPPSAALIVPPPSAALIAPPPPDALIAPPQPDALIAPPPSDTLVVPLDTLLAQPQTQTNNQRLTPRMLDEEAPEAPEVSFKVEVAPFELDQRLSGDEGMSYDVEDELDNFFEHADLGHVSSAPSTVKKKLGVKFSL